MKISGLSRLPASTMKFVPADPRTLQLDLDDGLEHFSNFLPMFLALDKVKKHLVSVAVTRSRNRNWHVTIKLSKPLQKWERVALQACLGSDRFRELHNVERIYRGSKHPILFIEK